MTFPNNKNRFEVQSHLEGRTLRHLIKQVEKDLLKSDTPNDTNSVTEHLSGQIIPVGLALATALTFGVAPGLLMLFASESATYFLSGDNSAESRVVNKLDIIPLAKYNYYNKPSTVFIETNLSKTQLDAVHELLMKRIKAQVPRDANGTLLAADTSEGIRFFSALKDNFRRAVQQHEAEKGPIKR